MSEILEVIVVGIGVVFLGLVSIIIICKIMSAFCNPKNSNKAEVTNKEKPENSDKPIENRQEILAAVCAVIAEELGTDIEALKVHSFKKI